MATAPTIYQKRLAVRRATADVERLGKQYQTGLLDLTQQQQNAFTQWQKTSAEQMAPYEASVKQYTNVEFPKYEKALETYNKTISEYEKKAAEYRLKLKAFQDGLEDIKKNPTEIVPLQTKAGGKSGMLLLIDGQWLYKGQAEERGYEVNERINQFYQLDGKQRKPVEARQVGRTQQFLINGEWLTEQQVQERGVNLQLINYEADLVKQRAVPTFTEEAPEAPNIQMPKAPKPPEKPPNIADFDVAPFDIQRGQLESTFKREVGERKAARQNVVMRRMNRPLLQEM